MQIDPHPDYPRLLTAMNRLRSEAGPWSGVIYRFAAPMYAGTDDLVSGLGSKKYGGRWNGPTVCAAVYGSLQPETPLKEIQRYAARYGIPFSDHLPRVLVAVEVTLQRALDLNAVDIRRRLRVSRRQMLQEEWWARQQAHEEALTQAIGRAALAAGLEALLVPSAADPRAVNFVIFVDNLDENSRLKVLP
jgi:RES domain-containing protein